MRYDKQNRATEALKDKLAVALNERDTAQEELDLIRGALDATMHEARRFSGEIAKLCGDLSKEASKSQSKILSSIADTIFYTSGMLSARLTFTDLELNPAAIARQQTFRSGIYKKFEKAKHVLEQSLRDKRIKVQFKGNSYSEIDAIQAIDLVPFVILDNAIKYSPNDQIITLEFSASTNHRGGELVVTSIGPRLDPSEAGRVFDQSFRGSNVKNLPGHGDGLGLYLAKKLCQLHDIDIHAEPSEEVRFVLNGVQYADFKIVLRWH